MRFRISYDGRAWRCVLICAATTLLIVSCAREDIAPVDVEKQAFDDLRTALREAIDDPVRENEAIRLVTLLEEDLAILRDNIGKRKKTARELNSDYDTTREEFEAFLHGVEADVRENRRRISDTHKALGAAATGEERSAVRKAHTKAMSMAIKTIQSI